MMTQFQISALGSKAYKAREAACRCCRGGHAGRRSEMSVQVLVDNLKRVIAILGTEPLLTALRA